MHQEAAALQCNGKSHCWARVIIIIVEIGSYQNNLIQSRSKSRPRRRTFSLGLTSRWNIDPDL